MSIKPRPQCRNYGKDDKRQDRECQQKVGEQDDIINGADPALRGEFDRTFPDGTHQAKMISQIAAQESGRTHERSDHTRDMDPLVFTPDCGPSDRDKASA